MQPTPHHPTQLSPALALSQLLAENPSLPPLFWDIRPDGDLNGHLWADDTRATEAAYRQVLGIDHVLTIGYSVRGVPMLGTSMSVLWRDVRVHLSFRSLASAYLAEEVAAA